MTMKHIALLVLVLCIGIKGDSGITSCVKKSDCSCQTSSNGTVIDLSSVGKMTYTDSRLNQIFTFEPCKNFDIGTLKGVTIAQYLGNYKSYFDIGSDPNVVFGVVSGKVQMTIMAADKQRKSIITMACSTLKTTLAFTIEQPVKTYNFNLEGSACCPKQPKPKPAPSPSSSSLSLGSLITIGFFSILIVYVVCGVLFTVFVRKAQGKERVPNRAFWSALPGLIRDGFKFTFTCGNRSMTYDRI